ncbi:hypothetical protein DPMN_091066 [Dreissena polymorpha]|uniref:Uncharacterized protein n=1 Tax=Dreissena polymorpha TaxID=45954 RepID=A0A9D4QYT3_DREPO|nr:hypothetical protein DPMN_091066 [Dreissena polymorpha]
MREVIRKTDARQPYIVMTEKSKVFATAAVSHPASHTDEGTTLLKPSAGSRCANSNGTIISIKTEKQRGGEDCSGITLPTILCVLTQAVWYYIYVLYLNTFVQEIVLDYTVVDI